MPLVESDPILDKIIDAPPVKLGYNQLSIPEDVDFTFIAVEHDDRFGKPDYLGPLLEEADVLFYELAAWRPQDQKSLQKIATGDFKALQRQKEETDLRIAHRAEQEMSHGGWTKVVLSALYRSNVRVVLPDYPFDHKEMRFGGAKRYGDTLVDVALGTVEEGEVFPIWARRDTYILQSICESIPALREQSSKLGKKLPLKALLLYGISHLSILDALAAGAGEQGIDSLQSQLLIQERSFKLLNEGDDPQTTLEGYEAADRITINYLNWLRTPENPQG